MDQRDWELLDKQMRRQQPPPPATASIILVFAIIFIAGLATGAILVPSGSPAVQTAGSTLVAAAVNPSIDGL